jgi:hypothetical protein
MVAMRQAVARALQKPPGMRYLIIVAALSAGCAGELSEPERFTGEGADASVGGVADAAPGAPDAGSVPSCGDVHADIIVPRCSGGACHDAATPAAGLDLGSAEVGARLIGVASACNGLLLIDPNDRPASYLLEKLAPSPTCGGQMPPGAPLSAADLACVIEWVEGL